ncbi:hypothetical protein B7494_g8033 [Chlorociboria aeruginascens]|nr:hypothetical protein B7494_g8033 [Chlorociboria aeruginascens]
MFVLLHEQAGDGRLVRGLRWFILSPYHLHKERGQCLSTARALLNSSVQKTLPRMDLEADNSRAWCWISKSVVQWIMLGYLSGHENRDMRSHSPGNIYSMPIMAPSPMVVLSTSIDTSIGYVWVPDDPPIPAVKEFGR